MTVPTYDHFVEPILRFLTAHPEGVAAGEAHEAAANSLGLSEEARIERLQAAYGESKRTAQAGPMIA